MFAFNCRCYFCAQRLNLPAHGICCFCLKRLPELPLCCRRCGLPAGSETEICGRCLLNSPPWQELIAVGDYKAPLKQLLVDFKFQRKTELTAMLARLFVLRWLEKRRFLALSKPDIIISVPLHRHRQWLRGFNQTDLLAAYLSRWLSCRWSPLFLDRVRVTPAQQTLSAAERRFNLFQAFRLNVDVKGLNIAVLDDVITTGSTLTEITHLLLANGARSVQAWCVCRTLLE